MSRRAELLLLLLLLVASSGCSPNIQDGVGPRVPIPNVDGSVLRSGAPAAGLKVALRDSSGVEVAGTVTTLSGYYGFGDVALGTWEVKVSGVSAGDFDSVARDFDLMDSTFSLRALDIHAYGAALLAPTDGASQPVPSPVQPVTFRWNLPSLPGVAARAQVLDSGGSAVWYSGGLQTSEVGWNGLGNQGRYQGVVVPPGSYNWRVKFDLPDSSQAKTSTRRLVLM